MRLEMCATCIFRPGNAMKLRPGRVKSMVEDCERKDGFIPCHLHLRNIGDKPVRRGATMVSCRGFYDARPEQRIYQLARRLGVLVYTDDDGNVVATHAVKGLIQRAAEENRRARAGTDVDP